MSSSNFNPTTKPNSDSKTNPKQTMWVPGPSFLNEISRISGIPIAQLSTPKANPQVTDKKGLKK